MNFGRKIAKWLTLYATYTISTSPNLCHRTTLLNTDVPKSLHNTGYLKVRDRLKPHKNFLRPSQDQDILAETTSLVLSVDTGYVDEVFVLYYAITQHK